MFICAFVESPIKSANYTKQCEVSTIDVHSQKVIRYGHMQFTTVRMLMMMVIGLAGGVAATTVTRVRRRGGWIDWISRCSIN